LPVALLSRCCDSVLQLPEPLTRQLQAPPFSAFSISSAAGTAYCSSIPGALAAAAALALLQGVSTPAPSAAAAAAAAAVVATAWSFRGKLLQEHTRSLNSGAARAKGGLTHARLWLQPERSHPQPCQRAQAATLGEPQSPPPPELLALRELDQQVQSRGRLPHVHPRDRGGRSAARALPRFRAA
jgi:hypothetical protein